MRSLALLLLPALVLGACSKNEGKKPADSKLGSGPAVVVAEGESAPKIVATLSVDWEGAYLSPEGVEALEDFRKQRPEAPITHFVCPAYFTHGDDKAEAAKAVKSHVRDGDEVGLNLHPWFSLAENAGVPPREAPNFYGVEAPLAEFPHGDQGYEVALGVYGPKELKKLISASAKLLVDNGLGTPTSFRTGGYVATPSVLEAARSSGMRVDSSAAWASWFEEAEGNFQGEVERLWPNMQELTQPYGIDTGAGPIVEVPNTGSFVDYATSDELLGHLQRAASQSKATGTAIYVNFGVHQESAHEFVGRLDKALKTFEEQTPGALEFTTVTKAADASMGTAH